jgi:hypothetical protein
MLTVHCPGAVIGGLNARRGTIIESEVSEDEFTAVAEGALSDVRASCVGRRRARVSSSWSTRCTFSAFDSGLEKRR